MLRNRFARDDNNFTVIASGTQWSVAIWFFTESLRLLRRITSSSQ